MAQHLHSHAVAARGGFVQVITSDTSSVVLLEVEEEGAEGRATACTALTPAEVNAVIAHLAQARDTAAQHVAAQLTLPLEV